MAVVVDWSDFVGHIRRAHRHRIRDWRSVAWSPAGHFVCEDCGGQPAELSGLKPLTFESAATVRMVSI